MSTTAIKIIVDTILATLAFMDLWFVKTVYVQFLLLMVLVLAQWLIFSNLDKRKS
ncbi:hypothetical protein [Lentilactobacillus sp. SPB1-3]|uniref:Uncharacterized protein n=1 Tax=Lentilactobacillus terminaliae TaxID=3003483 RepID=A0ACD5DEZ8_9LACO|nr:hypothetical protein [Lentilactobacillus sp. SPB1-3]MCZ0976350.1 hypothetical protein [Lentilactobacillus sp. SPB1-3]